MAFRAVPRKFLEQKKSWHRTATLYFCLHLTLGLASVVLCATYAANVRSETKFLKGSKPFAFGATAAALTFLMTVSRPDSRSTAYRAAARELERAIITFQTDASLGPNYLSEAEVRGIDLLGKLRPS